MCAYGNPRHSDVWLPIEFSISLSIYQSFALTSKTLYHQYLYAVESNVPYHKLLPLTFSPLQCTFVLDKLCAISKRFHNDCVIPSERYWSSTYASFCASQEEAIATLCDEKSNWWCDFCNTPLFKTRNCLFF